MHEEGLIWFAQAVVHSLWEGIAIGGVAWVLVTAVRGKPGRQHAILCGALLAMALCLPMNLAVVRPERAEAVGEEEVVGSQAFEWELAAGMSVTASPVESDYVDPAGETSPVVANGEAEGAGSGVAAMSWKSAAPWVVGIYAAGFLVMLGRFGLACGGSRKLRRRAELVEDEVWTKGFERVLRRLQVKTEPVLGWSQEVAAPVLVGVFKPMILLPVALVNRLTMEQVEAVLAHELAHLRRHDQWVLAFQRVAETVLFYHPVVWWLSRELGRTREQACDDLVLASGARPADYAGTLVLCSELRLAAAGLQGESAMQLAATGKGGTSLRERVHRVLGQEDPIRPGNAGWWLAGLVAVALVMAGAGLIPNAEAQKPTKQEGPEEVVANPLLKQPEPESEGAVDDGVVKGGRYVVEKGDSAWSIAQKFGMSVNELQKLNPDFNGRTLKVGQILVVNPAPSGPSFQVELVLAEVPADYKLDGTSLTPEVLAGRDDVKINSRPRLLVQDGESAKFEIGKAAVGGGNPAANLTVEVTVKSGGLKRDHDDPERAHIWYPIVSYDLRISQAREPAKGVVRSQTVEVGGIDPVGQWLPFEVGALKGDKKLAGAVRFTKVDPEKGVDKAEAFYLLPKGGVRWRGEVHELKILQMVLPKVGGTAVIHAPKETPYHLVVSVMNVLSPVYGKVGFAVQEEAREEREWNQNLGREKQIVECRVELSRLEAEMQKLVAGLEEDDPQIRKQQNKINTVRAYLQELEEAQREEAAAGKALLEPEAELERLRASGLGEIHPKVKAARSAIEKVRANHWYRTQILEAEQELAELLARGLGPQHPKVVAQQTWIEKMKAKPAPQGEDWWLNALPHRMNTPAAQEQVRRQLDLDFVRTLVRADAELRELKANVQAPGYLDKQVKVAAQQRRVDGLRRMMKAEERLDPELLSAVVRAELAEAVRERDALVAEGYGPKHPLNRIKTQRVEVLLEMLAEKELNQAPEEPAKGAADGPSSFRVEDDPKPYFAIGMQSRLNRLSEYPESEPSLPTDPVRKVRFQEREK